MPDPYLFLNSIGAAAIVSALTALALAVVLRKGRSTWQASLTVVPAFAGLMAGYAVLSPEVRWPSTGLDRLFLVVLPSVLLCECIAAAPRCAGWQGWTLRMILICAVPRILLHGSVYLSPTDPEWSLFQRLLVAGGCVTGLNVVWALLRQLSVRSPGISIPLAVALTAASSGMAIMLAGYIKGGAAALPVAAMLAGTVAAFRWARRPGDVSFDSRPLIGIGVVALFGLLFTGRFFGRLSTINSLALFLAPLLCWLTELPSLRRRRSWVVGTVRLGFVAIPLIVVLVQARSDFNRDLAPLLTVYEHQKDRYVGRTASVDGWRSVTARKVSIK